MPTKFYRPETYDWQESLGFLLAHVHLGLRRKLDEELAKTSDVTSAQWIILMILGHYGHATAAEMAKRLAYDPGSMTRILDRLQGKGLIQRVRQEDDRRCVLVELTEGGRRLMPVLPKASIKVLNDALAGFTEEEFQQLQKLLRRMLDNVR